MTNIKKIATDRFFKDKLMGLQSLVFTLLEKFFGYLWNDKKYENCNFEERTVEIVENGIILELFAKANSLKEIFLLLEGGV